LTVKQERVFEMEIGTEIRVKFGPYSTVAEVIEVTDRGAVLRFPYLAQLVGYDRVIQASDGTELTSDPAFGFLGSALFASAEIVRTP
jgi:hypothetical protein